MKHALEVGVKVIFCFGEKLEEREAGETMQVVIKQLEAVVPGINNWDNVVLVRNLFYSTNPRRFFLTKMQKGLRTSLGNRNW